MPSILRGAGFRAACLAAMLLAGCGRQGPPAVSTAPPVPTPAVALVTEVVSKEGQLRLKSTGAVFTGQLQDRYTNGVLKAEAAIRDGRMDGLTRGYFPSGRLQSEETFVAGVSEGVRRRFHVDGTLSSVEEIRQGRLHGPYVRFHPNGLPAEKGAYRDGEPEGLAESWDVAGRPVARVRFESGKVVEQVFLQGSAAAAVTAGSPHP